MKKVSKIIALMCALSLVLTLCACEDSEEEARAVVDSGFKALSSGELETIRTAVPGAEKLGSMYDFSSGDEITDEQASKVISTIFSNLTYEITEVQEVSKTEVNVKANVSNVDMASVITDWFTEVFSIAFSNQEASEDELSKLMLEAFEKQIEAKAKDKQIIESEVTVNVVKTKDGWAMNPDEECFDAITGGFITQISKISESLND